jgi:ribosome maturation factor RimP
LRRFFRIPEIGDQRFPILLLANMVNKAKIVELVKEKLDEKAFLVDVKVSASNVIKIFVDSYDSFTIDRCVEISRHLEKNLDREKEDFELQVSSPGLTESFRVKEQYLKNAGREVEIVTTDGTKRTGLLKEVKPEFVLLETSTREKVEGHKKKQLVVREHQIDYSDIKSAKVVVSFK